MIHDVVNNIKHHISFEPTRQAPKTIGEWIDGMDGESIKLLGLSSDEKFFEFVIRLLAVASNEKAWWAKLRASLYRDKTVDNLPSETVLELRLKEYGYRFPRQGAHVIVDASRIYDTYDRDWNQYFSDAVSHVRDGFLDDSFLSICGVGRKVRDLALTDFTLVYPVVDIHVKRVLNRLGYYKSKDPLAGVSSHEYQKMRMICLDLSDELHTKPAKLDRMLWHLGRSFCKKEPLCNECPNTKICPKVCTSFEEEKEE